MASINFPSFIKILSWTEKPQKSARRTQMESGIHKQQDRYFGKTFLIQSVEVLMTAAQYTAFKAFWTTTSGHGAVFFNITDPDTLATVEGRMQDGMFTANHINPRKQDEWIVSFEMEQLI